MSNIVKIVCFCAFCALVSTGMPAAKSESAAPVNEKKSDSPAAVAVPSVLQNASTAQVVASFSQLGPDKAMHETADVHVLVKAPDQVRIEPFAKSANGEPFSIGYYIADAKTQWEYERMTNLYQVSSPPNMIGSNRLVAYDAWVPLQLFPLQRYQAFSTGMPLISTSEEKLDGQDAIKTVRQNSIVRHVTWYAKESGLPIRFSVYDLKEKPPLETVRVIFGKWTIDQPASDKEFEWTPPENASKVKSPNTLRIGGNAPELVATDISNKNVRLSDCRGEPTLITFWSPWSDRSQDAVDAAKSIQQKAGKGKINVFAVCVWDTKADFDLWYLDHYASYPFPLLYDPSGQDRQSSAALFDYDLPSVPVWALVDKDGKIAAFQEDAGDDSQAKIDADVNKLLTSPPPSK